jgi:predicted metal-binding membrane protein
VGRVAGARTLWRLTPQAAALLTAAALAWVAIITWSPIGGAMAGRLEFVLPTFLITWTVMMAAMMLPSVAPVASLYSRSISERRALRLTLFTGGYLVTWVSAGVLAFALDAFVGGLADASPSLGTAASAGAYLVCGLYQLSPLKSRCLQQCRSPLSLVLKYGSYRGSLRDFRVGLHHGGYCLGCCWSLMVVLLALGAMSIVPMVVLAAIVMTEKLSSKGENFSRLVGVASLALAVATIWIPGLAPGFRME